MLQIKDLTYRIAGRPLLEGASVSIPDGHRVGLIGRNGSGKSTLLRLIAGEAQADAGSLELRPTAKLGVVAQEAPGGDTTPLELVLAADEERARLLDEAETATDPDRIGELHTRLADIGAHTAPSRAASILYGLGFDAEAQARPLGSFSGGWRMRVALAAALFAEPDLLLLDEPTNHLDLEAALWLENYLKTYPRTLLVVSHDRTLLNVVVTHIMHLEQNKLMLYKGGYDDFERQRSEHLMHQASAASRQEAQRKHLQSFVDRFRAKASKAKQAQSRLKMLSRLQPIATASEDKSVNFVFPEPEELAPPLIQMEHVETGYAPGKPILRHLNLRLDMDDRIALLGSNGNGKSTFARLLSGRLAPLAGKIRQSGKLRMGYFAQHQMEELKPEQTAAQHLSEKLPDLQEAKVRARLGQFGLEQNKAMVQVAALSGGEKARLLFALMSSAAPHVLILDEPTNHLDVDAREALVQAINDYSGAVILVSHDRHLIEACADRLWIVEDGTVTPFDGDLDDYAERLLERRRNANRAANKQKKGKAKAEEKPPAPVARGNIQSLRKGAREAEGILEKLTKQKALLDAELADPATYNEANAAQLAKLNKQHAELAKAMQAAESTWLAAQEALEAAE